MHETVCPDDAATKGLADCLVSKADTQDRHDARGCPHQRDRDARVGRRAWARGDDDGRRLERDRLVGGQGVVPVHDRIGPELAGVLHEVVGKAVVVIQDQQHALD